MDCLLFVILRITVKHFKVNTTDLQISCTNATHSSTLLKKAFSYRKKVISTPNFTAGTSVVSSLFLILYNWDQHFIKGQQIEVTTACRISFHKCWAVVLTFSYDKTSSSSSAWSEFPDDNKNWLEGYTSQTDDLPSLETKLWLKIHTFVQSSSWYCSSHSDIILTNSTFRSVHLLTSRKSQNSFCSLNFICSRLYILTQMPMVTAQQMQSKART